MVKEEEPEIEEVQVISAQASAAAKARIAAAARKRKSFAEDDDDDEEEEDEEGDETYTEPALASSSTSGKKTLVKVNPSAAVKKPNGALAFCAACKKRFTVTQYTAYIAKGAICSKCGNDATTIKSDPAAPKPAGASAATQRAAPRRKLVQNHEKEISTLQQYCINVRRSSFQPHQSTPD